MNDHLDIVPRLRDDAARFTRSSPTAKDILEAADAIEALREAALGYEEQWRATQEFAKGLEAQVVALTEDKKVLQSICWKRADAGDEECAHQDELLALRTLAQAVVDASDRYDLDPVRSKAVHALAALLTDTTEETP